MVWRSVERWLGLVRSLIIYWRPGRQRGLRELYRPFVGAGDLAFDVGAHLGDRTYAFRKLGARVVALEPQPAVRRWLVLLVGRSRDVSVRAEAVGRAVGTARLALSRRTPSMSSLAEDWPTTLAHRNPVFSGVRWDDSVTVPVTTLDALIEGVWPSSLLQDRRGGVRSRGAGGVESPYPRAIRRVRGRGSGRRRGVRAEARGAKWVRVQRGRRRGEEIRVEAVARGR